MPGTDTGRFASLANAATVVLAVCALGITGLVVRREFLVPGAAAAPVPKPRPIDNWRELAASGHVMGRSDAPVIILEFSDFQCPFCAAVQVPLHAVRTRHAAEVQVVYRHFPLESIHPYSLAAALGSECAADQGVFEGFHDALFSRQGMIGSESWLDFAREAGVADTSRFRRCMASREFLATVRADARAAQRTGIAGTPGIIINGTLLPDTPTEDELERYVVASLARRDSTAP